MPCCSRRIQLTVWHPQNVLLQRAVDLPNWLNEWWEEFVYASRLPLNYNRILVLILPVQVSAQPRAHSHLQQCVCGGQSCVPHYRPLLEGCRCGACYRTSHAAEEHVARHTSHVTRHTSHVTRHPGALHALFEWRRQIVDGSLHPDFLEPLPLPLCSRQYERLFNVR